ncbi:hypothetical protein [Archangium sp.]|uniref:hypothetical protein n=1 Tax=Archangium sp. TaxID=1872627 RepID=UPI002D57DC65|nr:hypothetical protein [Archangium sp.]HYO57349.1 hypothetical protein [Archangium sp.]
MGLQPVFICGQNQGMTRPEALARETIDDALRLAGWIIQDAKEANVDASPGVAVREFPLGKKYGFADYLLYVNGEAAGIIEAKKTSSPRSTTSSSSPRTRWTASPASASPPSSACTPCSRVSRTWTPNVHAGGAQPVALRTDEGPGCPGDQ